AQIDKVRICRVDSNCQIVIALTATIVTQRKNDRDIVDLAPGRSHVVQSVHSLKRPIRARHESVDDTGAILLYTQSDPTYIRRREGGSSRVPGHAVCRVKHSGTPLGCEESN